MQLITENISGVVPLYNISFIEDLQDRVDAKSSKAINKLLASKKNDLDLYFNFDASFKLSVYYNILENIKSCNACFEEMDIEEIISLVDNTLNTIK